MNLIFDYLFEQYSSYQIHDIALEIIGVIFGFFSVWYAKKNHIGVFPTGLISTSIFVYLLFKWGLLGDMLINAYYFVMSIYGWYIWTRKGEGNVVTPITAMNPKDWKKAIILFIASLLFVVLVYVYFDKWFSWTAYTDSFTTAIFFTGMWLMAKRKVENWLFWILADTISVPLYIYKGLAFTAIQYLIFTFIAIFGYRLWKNSLIK